MKTQNAIELKSYTSYSRCVNDLIKQGCKDLGWLNDGIKIPKGHYIEVYENHYDNESVYLDKDLKVFYSVNTSD